MIHFIKFEAIYSYLNSDLLSSSYYDSDRTQM